MKSNVINAAFANLLAKYVTAKKLNNAAFTKQFIEAHSNERHSAKMPSEATDEVVAYATTFVAKKAKCTDSEFSAKMAEFATKTITEKFVPKKTISVNGEY